MEWIVAIPHLLSSGVGNLASYLAAHVLLCLLPAFYMVLRGSVGKGKLTDRDRVNW